jgi:hypothetical protein
MILRLKVTCTLQSDPTICGDMVADYCQAVQAFIPSAVSFPRSRAFHLAEGAHRPA